MAASPRTGIDQSGRCTRCNANTWETLDQSAFHADDRGIAEEVTYRCRDCRRTATISRTRTQ